MKAKAFLLFLLLAFSFFLNLNKICEARPISSDKNYPLPTKVIKRNGTYADFDVNKIRRVIALGLKNVNKYSKEIEEMILERVLRTIHDTFIEPAKNSRENSKELIPSVEQIQDIVEISFMKAGLFDVAKSYILFRERKAAIRKEKMKLLEKEKLDNLDKQFSLNAIKLLSKRYLARDEEGKLKEDPRGLFERVALLGALGDILFSPEIYSKEAVYDKEIEDVSYFINHFEEFDNVFSIGHYRLTKYHFLQFCKAFARLKKQGHMKINFRRLIAKWQNKEFDTFERNVEEYFYLMATQTIMPNSPALINAGRKNGMLSACFTLAVEDTLESVMKLMSDIAIIQKQGGGTGVNFSPLRPKGDPVGSFKGIASGPLAFLQLIDKMGDYISQGGFRRSTNMGILNINHPDIESFIRLKEEDGTYSNFNISVGVWEDFWEALLNNREYPLVNPRNNTIKAKVEAKTLLEMIAYFAWSTGDPGMLFFDNINRHNVLIKAKKGKVEVTNPCGEEPLYPYESCNLASINLVKFVRDGAFDYQGFSKVVRTTARLLDNFLELNNFPIPEVEENSLLTRRIGVGMMGLADALYLLGIRYNSELGYKTMGRIAEALTYYAYEESIRLAEERGSFPLFPQTDYVNGNFPIEGFYHPEEWTFDWQRLSERVKKGVRNAMVTTAPPTGSVSMIADTSSGIEPNFSLVFSKNVSIGEFFYINPVFEKRLKESNIFSQALIDEISKNHGSIQGIERIPQEIKNVFVTALDIHWLDHIIAQATLQRWITDSISKTINMLSTASVQDVKEAYVLAHALGCKGITVYRDGSKSAQVLTVEDSSKKESFQLHPSSYAIKILKELVKKEPLLLNHINLEKFINSEHKKTENIDRKFPLLNSNHTYHSSSAKKKARLNHKEKCPECGTELIYESGCAKCPNCGWSKCVIS